MTNILRTLAILLPIAGFIACTDNDKDVKTSKVPAPVKNTLTELFPDANYVEWELVHGYYVADFYNAEDRSEKEVWIDKDGDWELTVSDITFNQLPEEVKSSFESGEYKDWYADDVDVITRPQYATVYILDVEQRNSERERVLYYKADGELYKTTGDRDPNYKAFITEEYPK